MTDLRKADEKLKEKYEKKLWCDLKNDKLNKGTDMKTDRERIIDTIEILDNKGIKSLIDCLDWANVLKNHVKANPIDALVREKIAKVEEKIKEHFEGDRTRLDKISEEMGLDEFEGRKAEIERQKHYVLQILSNFTA